MSPAFSLSNLKNIAAYMDEISLNLVNSIKAGDSDELEMEKLCKRFAMDCIGRIVFSMDFEAINKPEDNVVRSWMRR